MADAMEDVIATQPASQPLLGTGEASQAQAANAHLWGALIPTSQNLKRLDMWIGQPTYTLGRHHTCDFRLSSPKISNFHCSITWRGADPHGDPAEVVVEDLSTNGTFVNGVKIGKGKRLLLEQGSEISFGVSTADPGTSPDDLRYLYRHLGNPNPQSSVFDQYQLSSELGRGAFASVRRAIGINDGLTYAVKVISQRRLGTTALHARMLAREVDILRSLDHPNIVRCHGIFSDPATIYIVMEFVEGGDLLDAVIKSVHGLDEKEAKGLTRDICVAMEYLHTHGIVHRDLKPENVLITTGTPRRAKIADFGLAKVIDSATFLRTACGTPAYLAPEVLLHTQEPGWTGYTSAVDIWSIGVMVFSMLTMAMPFGEEDENLSHAERAANRNVAWELIEGKSADAQDWLRRVLKLEPSQRMRMDEALNHRWLLDPYGDSSFAVPTPGTPRAVTPTMGPRFAFGGRFDRNLPAGPNGVALPGAREAADALQANSSDFIYGNGDEAGAAMEEDRGPSGSGGAGAGVSSLGLGRMALDSVADVVYSSSGSPASGSPPVDSKTPANNNGNGNGNGKKRPATDSMELVPPSPAKKRHEAFAA